MLRQRGKFAQRSPGPNSMAAPTSNPVILYPAVGNQEISFKGSIKATLPAH